jgi:hypothetical protein
MTKIRKQFPNNNIYIQVLSSWFLVLGSTPGERSIKGWRMALGARRKGQRAGAHYIVEAGFKPVYLVLLRNPRNAECGLRISIEQNVHGS